MLLLAGKNGFDLGPKFSMIKIKLIKSIQNNDFIYSFYVFYGKLQSSSICRKLNDSVKILSTNIKTFCLDFSFIMHLSFISQKFQSIYCKFSKDQIEIIKFTHIQNVKVKF